MNAIIYILVSLILVALLMGFSNFTYAADANITVNVSIGTLSQISVNPTFINWTNIIPGTAGGLQQIEVTNSGSVNVTNLYVYTNTLAVEDDRPYSGSDPTQYSSTGLVVIRNNTNTTLYFAGRIEWNETQNLSNSDFSAVSTVDSTLSSFGFFRNASYEYVWAVGSNSTTGWCNGTATIGGVSFALESDTDTGTVATRTPTTAGITKDGADAQWTYFRINRAGHILNDHCVAVNRTCDKIFVYKYDRRSGFNTCTNSQDSNPAPIVPGGAHTFTVNVHVPNGLPLGNLSSSVLIFTAS